MKHYWAYAISKDNTACIARVNDADDAEWEKDRMKIGNNFVRVGFTRIARTEAEMIAYLNSFDVRVEHIHYRNADAVAS